MVDPDTPMHQQHEHDTALWYAVHTKVRKEAEAERQLLNQGFETYLPRLLVKKRRRGRWHEAVEPLFPRYLFIRVDPQVQSIAPVRSTLGVSSLVRFGLELATVPDAMIAALRRREDPTRGLHLDGHADWQPGDKVLVAAGPLAGLEGVFQGASGEQRALILIELLGRVNTVLVDRDNIVTRDA